MRDAEKKKHPVKFTKEDNSMISFLKENEQHQHPNGGGWVANTATVAPSAFVGRYARVHGDARVSGNARVYGNAWVSGNAQMSGNARVFGNAQLSGDAWVLNPLTIIGSAHTVSLVSYTQIAVGCEIHDFAYWLKNYKTVGKENDYNPEQIKEYGEILNYLVKAAKPYIKRNKAKVKQVGQ